MVQLRRSRCHVSLNLASQLVGMLRNNRVVSGMIRASYYETSERHKGANEGGVGCRGVRGAGRGVSREVEVAYESCQRLIFPSVVGAALIDKSRGSRRARSPLAAR